MDRESIINFYSKNDFMNFLREDYDGKIFELFNEEGINILKNSGLKEERINYILTFSKYRDELFKTPSFSDLVLSSNINSFGPGMSILELSTCNVLIQRCLEQNKDIDLISNLFNWFSTENKISIVENMNFSQDILYELFKKSEPAVVQKILASNTIDLTKNDIELEFFFSRAKEATVCARSKRNSEGQIIDDLSLPPQMITEEVAKKIWNEYDIFKIRKIINDIEYSADASTINQYVKYKENEIITNYDFSSFLPQFQDLYESYKKFKLTEIGYMNDAVDDEIYTMARRQFLTLANKFEDVDFVYLFNKAYNETEFSGVEAVVRSFSDRMLSNYIIDYLFEENYHNIIIDIRELLNFYYNGNISLSSEKIEIYEKLSNIDYLSAEEKIELFTYLKNFNMIETFYDDMRFARNIVAGAIKDYSLSSQTLHQYKDEELSKQYGVDVYTLNGDSFFGIVKSGIRAPDNLPTGHSYSLVGDGCIAVFGDLNDSDTFLYDSDDMNPEQLVHAFPFDSFTYYHPLESSYDSTKRVNRLLMPDEIVYEATSYTELLMLEKGKKDTEIDHRIPQLKRIALFCVDEISAKDVQQAKANNVGIVLVPSSKYKEKSELLYNFNKSDVNDYENNYFNGYYEKDKFEARR